MAEEEKVETLESKKNIIEVAKAHPKATFVIRLIAWILASAILPFLFIAFRYGLFSKTASLSGWGIVGLVILAAFVITLIKSVSSIVKSDHPFIAQCIKGFCAVIIPLIILYAIVSIIHDNTGLFMQCLGCVIVCEAIGIPLNPLPQLAFERQKELKVSERKETMDYFINTWFEKRKESGK